MHKNAKYLFNYPEPSKIPPCQANITWT